LYLNIFLKERGDDTMGKQRRGKIIKKISGWRGTCPLCGRKRVKLVWTKKCEDGKVINICKLCSSKITQ